MLVVIVLLVFLWLLGLFMWCLQWLNILYYCMSIVVGLLCRHLPIRVVPFVHWVLTTLWHYTILATHTHIKDIFLDLFLYSLNLLLNILNNQLILLDLRYQLRVLLQLMCKFHSQFQVRYPFLCRLTELACVYLLVRLLDYEVNELFFHMPWFLLLLENVDLLQAG